MADKKLEREFDSKSSAEMVKQTTDLENMRSKVLNREQLEIEKWLKEVEFRKRVVGGVDEQDVWKKINKLNDLYESALKAERIRYDVLLAKNENKGLNPEKEKQSKDNDAND